MPTPATESHEQNLYLRIQNSTMSEAMHDVARRLGFVYLGAQGFAGAVHRAVECAAIRHVGEMAAALRDAGVAADIIESAVFARLRAAEASASGLDLSPLTRAIEAKVIVARGEMVVASSDHGTHRFPAAPEVVAAWAAKIGQRVSLEWSLVPLGGDAPAPEAQSASEGVGAGVLHPSHRSGL